MCACVCKLSPLKATACLSLLDKVVAPGILLLPLHSISSSLAFAQPPRKKIRKRGKAEVSEAKKTDVLLVQHMSYVYLALAKHAKCVSALFNKRE